MAANLLVEVDANFTAFTIDHKSVKKMSAASSTNKPRIALMTSGLSPVAEYFASLPASPVGIINWNNSPVDYSHKPAKSNTKRKLHALIRRRQYANLQHLCDTNNLLYADIYKRDLETLTLTLAQWSCSLVITSRCSLVPTTALSELSHGAINLHPSWLPAYRGAEPLLWQIADNQEFIAASIHRLTDEYDCGAILAQYKMPRPRATDKASLLRLADTVLGHTLLTDVITELTENPNSCGVEQMSDDGTRYASRESSDSFGERVPLDTLTAETVWDLSHYFGHCPMPWLVGLGLSGWRTKTQWQPAHLKSSPSSSGNGQWSIKVSAGSVHLISEASIIMLKPALATLYKVIKS